MSKISSQAQDLAARARDIKKELEEAEVCITIWESKYLGEVCFVEQQQHQKMLLAVD